ncbi:hypothetical protein [Phenylobacterium sp.]|uniref:hypothetical protein n=1 Tax=Phenylobacterium sp. TaxID=1871053 RepID=UPI0027308A5B|nr:hypothetical protein [Phenylobacterium sp.]MDP1616810.1 hypothetical protein [Phenylobacterium sp.]MDP1986281.1 hypothetical protein [Phenylobacterium sp.]
MQPIVTDAELSAAYAGLDHADEQAWRHGQATRAWGAGWSALAPEPRRRRSPDQLRDLAQSRLAAAQAWAQSPEGRLKSALTDLQHAARALDQQAEALREAASRGLADTTTPNARRRLWAMSQEARAALAALRAIRSVRP